MSECQKCGKQTEDIYKYAVSGVKLKLGLCKDCYEADVRNYQKSVHSEPKKAKVVSGGLRGLDVYKEKGQWHAGE